ncbi:CPBP family intramembrane glutamic endopeptidase [Streptomyces sp. NPDC006261]|uniref:CPBP family intramembrane glutamic endopeptidase n=1 Tax=Streptomyces sp. NPDC006261 TaxID=3156739 RepID=UPI0033B1000B
MGTTSALRHDQGSGPGRHPDGGSGRFGLIARHPLGWMLAGMAGVGLLSGLTATGPGPVPALGAVAAVAVYWLVMRRVARRSTPEIARSGAAREVLLGGTIGLVFILVSALLIRALGGYSFTWGNDGVLSVAGTAVAVQIGAAVTEELLFRGLVLQALEQLWGSGAAIVITALFFGAAHMGSEGANAWSGLAIALEAGVLLGAAFLWRRSIWFVVGLHFAWNVTEQLLGIPVSGHAPNGLFIVDVDGSNLLTGGSFGLEASIIPVVMSMTIAVVMLVHAHRNGGIKCRRPAGR